MVNTEKDIIYKYRALFPKSYITNELIDMIDIRQNLKILNMNYLIIDT